MDIRYIAGFFDGEGCVGIQKRYEPERKGQNLRYRMYVQITVSTPNVLQKIHKEFGGYFYKGCMQYVVSKNPRQIWVLKWGGRKAADFLRVILPFLILKKKEAQLAIKFQEHLDNYWKPGMSMKLGLKREELKYRRKNYLKMRSLKRTINENLLYRKT